jgi:hypothetical protein
MATETALAAVEAAPPEVTAEQLAARRVAAFHKLVQARRLQDEADEEMILCDLADAEPAARAAKEQATADREAAEEVPKAGQVKLDALKARLTTLQERAAAAKSVTAVEDLDAYLSTDVNDSVNARRDRLALEEEAAEIRQRIGLLSNLLSPPVATLRDAEIAEKVAEGRYQAIMEAAIDPLGHRRAWDTDAFKQRMARLYAEVLAIPGHPDWLPAVAALKDTLRASGVGEQVQREGIQAYAAGDPVARSVGVNTRHLAGGDTVIAPADGPAVVYHGGATPQQLAAAPGLPQTDTSPAGAVMAREWAGIRHNTAPGLPGLAQ